MIGRRPPAPLSSRISINLRLQFSKIVFTIHNIEYQGKCAVIDLDRIGLKGEDYLVPEKMQDTVYLKELICSREASSIPISSQRCPPIMLKEVKTPTGAAASIKF